MQINSKAKITYKLSFINKNVTESCVLKFLLIFDH